jgi:hypothetical protein
MCVCMCVCVRERGYFGACELLCVLCVFLRGGGGRGGRWAPPCPAVSLVCSICVHLGGRVLQDAGKSAAKRVLKQVLRRGCVDAHSQPWVCLLMVLTPEDVSRVRFGKKMSADW